MSILTDEEMKALLPVNDGYSYYMGFGEAIAQAQEAKTKKELADLAPDKVREAVREKIDVFIKDGTWAGLLDDGDGGPGVFYRQTDLDYCVAGILALHTAQMEAATKELKEELRVGNILTAKLTDEWWVAGRLD